jgi:hypothetical protein
VTKDEFLEAVGHYRRTYPDQRYGQAIFNLAFTQPELRETVDSLWSTDLDPFYRDDRVDDFLAALFPEDS